MNISHCCHENKTFPVTTMDKFYLIEKVFLKKKAGQICYALTSVWIPVWFRLLGNLFVGELGGRVYNWAVNQMQWCKREAIWLTAVFHVEKNDKFLCSVPTNIIILYRENTLLNTCADPRLFFSKST